MYGTQTCIDVVFAILVFENDVEMYGTQTHLLQKLVHHRLRMM